MWHAVTLARGSSMEAAAGSTGGNTDTNPVQDAWAACRRSTALDDGCFDDSDSMSSATSEGSDAVSGVDEPADLKDEPIATKKRKADAGPVQRKTIKRTVSFSSQCVTRITDETAAEPLPGSAVAAAAAVDMEGTLKSEDGPKPSSQLLDDLVISFFERGTINGPEDLRALIVQNPTFQDEIPCVTDRLDKVVDRLDGMDTLVGRCSATTEQTNGHEAEPNRHAALPHCAIALPNLCPRQVAHHPHLKTRRGFRRFRESVLGKPLADQLDSLSHQASPHIHSYSTPSSVMLTQCNSMRLEGNLG